MATLAEVGVSMKEATEALLADAVKKFSDPFDSLLAAVEKRRQALIGGGVTTQTYNVGEHDKAVKATLEDWRVHGKVRRLWAGDASLWTDTDEGRWLGWLHVADDQIAHSEHFQTLIEDVKSAGFTHAVVLGMGGSSLCPDVLRKTFGKVVGFPELLVLDSTVPAQVKALEKKIDPAKTLFIVSSKSGGTVEPNVFKQYFFEKTKAVVGVGKVGGHFAAITDPKTKMHTVAKNDHFRHIFFGLPSIGGRFSALSNFGMIPGMPRRAWTC